MDLIKTLSELSFLRQQLAFFCLLFFALPPLSFIAIKFLLGARAASRTQRTTQWFVPQDLDSDAMRNLFDRQPAPAFSTRQIHPDPRRAKEVSGPRTKNRS